MPYKKSIYKRFFLLFLTIVTIYTSILAGTLVVKQQETIQQNNEYLNEFYIAQMANNIDYKLNIALQTAQAIAYKDSVAEYRSNSLNDYVVTMRVYDDIRSTLNPMRSLDFEIGLTTGGNDFISSDGFFSGGGYLEYIGLDEESFGNPSTLFENEDSRIHIISEPLTTTNGNNTIIYQFKHRRQEADLFIFITFRKNRLISTELPNGIGALNVWSSDKNASFASRFDGQQMVPDVAGMDFKVELENHRVERGQNKDFVAYRVHSDVLRDLDYIYSMRLDDLKRLNDGQLQLFPLLIILLVLGGGIIIYLATKQSYSPIQEMLNKIPESYSEATDPENELEFIVSTIRRTNEDNIRLLDKQKYNYSLEAERGLVQAIRDSDRDNMHTILSEILTSNLKAEAMDAYSISCFKYALLSTVKRILRSHNQSVFHFVEQNHATFQELAANDPERLCNAFESIFDSLASNCTADEEMLYSSPTTTKILNYIHEHCLEDLSLAMISEHFDLTEGYVSKLLKETANIKFKNYLNHLKIKKSKELLQTGKYKITEVSGMVGYNNVNSFIRVFKREEGISPGNYKKIND